MRRKQKYVWTEYHQNNFPKKLTLKQSSTSYCANIDDVSTIQFIQSMYKQQQQKCSLLVT